MNKKVWYRIAVYTVILALLISLLSVGAVYSDRQYLIISGCFLGVFILTAIYNEIYIFIKILKENNVILMWTN